MKKNLQNVLLSLISIALTFLAFELFLYLNHFSPDYERYKLVLNDVKLTFNDDPDVYFKDDNKYKTIFLGDSFTVGEVCAHDKRDFVNLIKSKHEDNDNHIYNFGSLGISPSDMINIYDYLKKGDFNQLVIVLYYNDIFLSHQTCENLKNFKNNNIPKVAVCDKILRKTEDSSSNTKLKKLDNFLETNFFTWQLVKQSLANSPYFSKFYSRSEWRNLYQNAESEEFKLLLNILIYFKKESQQSNFNLVFTYFPDVNYINSDNPLHEDWLSFINVAKQENIIIHDPWEFFLGNTTKQDLTWSLTDDHPNCDAHKLMYDYIDKNLINFN